MENNNRTQQEKKVCDACFSEHAADDLVEVLMDRSGRKRHWCKSCVEKYATKCTECGAYFYGGRGGGHPTRDGFACVHCLPSFFYCEECGEYVRAEDFDRELNACNKCKGNRLIGRYHSHHNRPFFGIISRGRQPFTIGFELEIDRRNHSGEAESRCALQLNDLLGKRADFERDGSLNCGFEIISAPHTVKDFYKNFPLADMLQIARNNGYSSHDIGTCGLHFHIGRRFFGNTEQEQERAIAKLIVFHDLFYSDILKYSRRDTYEAERWAGKHNASGRKEARERAKPCATERYHALNTTNEKTVEFRIMRGTLNEDTFRASLDFCLTIAKASKRIPWRKVRDPRAWLAGLAEPSKRYAKERGAFMEVL